ncbi:YceI family protein [Polymorphobacter sp. PAMC 29334]|uniref:YceI family protein n=1 Tax=Polymorphobacter sp. PAMC 29334 TaxID=2862331 RepID=UPI001C67044F|nr:YceI family protein [Polymorphobacter sp. PAMC 29334]QYE36329.1 YceI family protein [Polymorphobacter sp. PAMC 29334]
MNRYALVCFAGAALVAATPALASDWTVDPVKSRIAFSSTQTGTRFQGRFERFNAAIRFDPAHPEMARIVVLVDLASGKTGDQQRDSAMPTADWFDVEHSRVARFEATGVRRAGLDGYLAQGTLTLRGQTRSVALPFKLQIVGRVAHATGHAQLTRTAFGVGQGAWASGQWVALEVDVDIDMVASRK